MCIFLLCLILCMSRWSDVENEQRSGVDVENERAEWMWRMSERSGCGEYLMRRISDEDIYLRLAKKINTFMCFCFVLI